MNGERLLVFLWIMIVTGMFSTYSPDSSAVSPQLIVDNFAVTNKDHQGMLQIATMKAGVMIRDDYLIKTVKQMNSGT